MKPFGDLGRPHQSVNDPVRPIRSTGSHLSGVTVSQMISFSLLTLCNEAEMHVYQRSPCGRVGRTFHPCAFAVPYPHKLLSP